MSTATRIFTPGGPIDKIVEIRLSAAHTLLTTFLRRVHNDGEATIPNPWQVASGLVSEIEANSKTIATIINE